ncbi:MAG: hypothetical protein QGF74_01075 [Candidatus Nanoarchaeia archaeon]|jgi:hypothetical protein|nr:hypothetical protein [Candidatus Nanoarchaeia archaeon]|tara:strand:- start:1214 stop:2041 length:828 start_codon:yes stop_codon:yes gene_type:complete
MYKERVIKTFKNLEFLLFVPDLILLIFTFLSGFVFVKYSGVLNLLTDANKLASSLRVADSIEALAPIFTSLVQKDVLVVLIYLLIFFLGGFVLGSGLLAMKFGMMKDVVEKKKLSLKNMYDHSMNHFWDVVWLRLTIFLISLAVIVSFAMLASLNALNSFYQETFFILISILFLLTLIFLRFLLLFRYPALFFDRTNSTQTVKKLYDYFLKNYKHIILTWLVIFGFGLIIVLLDLSLNKITIISLLVIVIAIRYIINLIYNVWSDLFLFYNYKLE